MRRFAWTLLLILCAALPPCAAPGSAAEVLQRFRGTNTGASPSPWNGPFRLETGEVVVFAGGMNFVLEQKAGELEGRLAAAFAAERPRFRSMAWEGDTVYEQWRDLNFGSWTSQLEAAGATVVMAQFGQLESLDGPNRLPEFTAAFHRLLDQFAARTPRLVIVSPMPFETPRATHAPDLALRNTDVAAYTEVMRRIARERGAIFVDLFYALRGRSSRAERLTENGMHLTEEGVRVVAGLVGRELGLPSTTKRRYNDLQAAIQEKNRLWFDCWRPANWSFVYGDRVSQLFAKPGGGAPSLAALFEAHKPLLTQWEEHIHRLARGERSVAPEPPMVSASQSEQLTPEAELASFTVADGYEVNLFACEREGVVKPTQLSWDERGRLYVACSPTYPHISAGPKPHDYVLVLEDANGDGRADKSWRFIEGLTMVQGVEPGAGGLYVCDYDQLLHVRDANGDGRGEERRVVFSGFGVGDTHQLINSISHGPDGSLWFTQGLHAFSRVETPWGLARLDRAGLWRLRPRSLRLDSFFNGAKAGHNCWGVAFDDYGQVFHKSGDRPDGYYTVPGLVRVSDPAEYHPLGSLFRSPSKTTGLEIIGTRALPEDAQGCALIGDYFGHKVERHRFSDKGSGFATTMLPPLLKSSSTSFRPVDLSVGPDGAMYVADWFNPIIGHYQASYADPRRDKAHGRIWRIAAKGGPRVTPPRLAGMSPRRLVEQLRSPERWTRYQAKRLLFDAPTKPVVQAVSRWVANLPANEADYERLLIEAIGIFEAHEIAHPDLLAKILSARDPRVRAYGTRVVGAWASHLPEPLRLLRERVGDPHPRVRLEAVVACSYFPQPAAVEVALQALDFPRDSFIDYALAHTVRALKPQWGPAFTENRLSLNDKARDYLRKVAGDVASAPPPGKVVYEMACLPCHQPDGKGLPGIYPSLVGSERVRGAPAALIKIVLHGLTGSLTAAGKELGNGETSVPMPAFGTLDDGQIADVLTYLRSSFGNAAPAVTSKDVRAVRSVTQGREAPWTAAELQGTSR